MQPHFPSPKMERMSKSSSASDTTTAAAAAHDAPPNDAPPPREHLRIAMCCDFFYPRLGGVEMHIWSLAQCLLRLGHKVIIVTHAIEESPHLPSSSSSPPQAEKQPQRPQQRVGVRWMTNGLKAYYLPIHPMVDNVTYPTFIGNFALFRSICIRERIQIVHGHQATSTFMHECLMQAKTLGFVRTIYTDHSLFGFADAASVHLNKVMKFSLSTVDHAICVSHTCKENLVLRASISPDLVSTIPNAVDASKFTPPSPAKVVLPGDNSTTSGSSINTTSRTIDSSKDRINVVIISRLVYRKGIDLVGPAIQIVCKAKPNVHFIIGGDGPKRLLLEEMREKHRLHDRVHLYGAVPHAKVRNVLCEGHIFLNSSLTESFCIAILEAASCGLFVVSTRVGGVPEVLPPEMIKFAKETTPEALAQAVLDALPLVEQVDRQQFHDKVAQMYNWHDVALRTQKVYYTKVMARPVMPLLERFQKYYGIGPIAGALACVIAAVLHLYLYLLQWWKPEDEIEEAIDWQRQPSPSPSPSVPVMMAGQSKKKE